MVSVLFSIQQNASPFSATDGDQLLHGIASGNQDALVDLYNQTKAAVFGFALSIVRNQHDAEDIMQETYVHIFTSAASYVSQGKPMAWILTIVRNLAYMKLRERKKSLVALEKQHFSATESDSTEQSLNRLILETAMTVLSDEERQIVVLHSLSGLKHREIAALLQLPLSTELSKYRRALAKVKTQLSGGEAR